MAAEELHTSRVLGRALLELYAAAREVELAEFPLRALELLRAAIPFDFAWWGISRRGTKGRFFLHTSVSLDAPAEYLEQFDQIVADEAGAHATQATGGIAHLYLTADLRQSTFLARRLRDLRIEQALLIARRHAQLGLANFLGLYRNPATPVFSASEHLLLELLMPHLIASRNSNWITMLDGSRAGAAQHGAMAVADRFGVLHSASARFEEQLRAHWPEWRGPALPPPLLECIARTMPYDSDSFVIDTHEVNGLNLLELRRKSPLCVLSARELAIAEHFSSGLSNKDIAVRLAIAPATVRHHLRNVYRKLGVNDKAQLAGVVHAAHDTSN